MLKEQDFIFTKMEEPYKDYWFIVDGDSKKELTNKYMEMCMVEVPEVVYSQSENIVGIKRLFPFNYDVITTEDNELRAILSAVVNKLEDKNE